MIFMDKILRKFRDDALALLGSNLVCLMHHGSRAKCEAHAESDYDSIIVTRKVDVAVIKTVRNLLQRNPNFTTYLLGLHELESLPKGHLLEFQHARPLYGKFSVKTPTKEDVRQYLAHSRRDELFSIRHWLVLPHQIERKARMTYYEMKFVYVYLSFLAFVETGKLPLTRKQTIAHFNHREKYSQGIKLLHILDDWTNHKDKVAKNPDHYLFMLEKFFREARP